MDDLQRPLDLLDLLKADQSAADASMQANNSVLDHSRQRKPIEEVVDFVEYRVVISRILP